MLSAEAQRTVLGAILLLGFISMGLVMQEMWSRAEGKRRPGEVDGKVVKVVERGEEFDSFVIEVDGKAVDAYTIGYSLHENDKVYAKPEFAPGETPKYYLRKKNKYALRAR